MGGKFAKKLRAKRAMGLSDGGELTPDETMDRLWTDYEYYLQGKNSTASTIKAYSKQFDKICLFIGHYSLSKSIKLDSLDRVRILFLINEGLKAPISTLDETDIGAYYYDWLVNNFDLSEQTVITCMRAFRTLYYWLAERKLVRPQKIRFSITPPPIRATFTEAELRRLTHAHPNINNMVDYRDWAIIMWLIHSACRIGSVLELKVGDVDFEACEVRVQHTKTRIPQRVVINSTMQSIFAEWITAYRVNDAGKPLVDDYLFCNAYGGKLSYEAAVASQKRYFAARDVDWKGFHNFRHTYAKHHIIAGGDILTLQHILGHSNISQSARYANLYGTDTAIAAQKFGLQNVVKIDKGRSKLKLKKKG